MEETKGIRNMIQWYLAKQAKLPLMSFRSKLEYNLMEEHYVERIAYWTNELSTFKRLSND